MRYGLKSSEQFTVKSRCEESAFCIGHVKGSKRSGVDRYLRVAHRYCRAPFEGHDVQKQIDVLLGGKVGLIGGRRLQGKRLTMLDASTVQTIGVAEWPFQGNQMHLKN